MTVKNCVQSISSQGPFGLPDTSVPYVERMFLEECGPVTRWERDREIAAAMRAEASISAALENPTSNSLLSAVAPLSSLSLPLEIAFMNSGIAATQNALPNRLKRAFSILKYPAMFFVPSFRQAMTVVGVVKKVADKTGDRVVQALVGRDPLAGLDFRM